MKLSPIFLARPSSNFQVERKTRSARYFSYQSLTRGARVIKSPVDLGVTYTSSVERSCSRTVIFDSLLEGPARPASKFQAVANLFTLVELRWRNTNLSSLLPSACFKFQTSKLCSGQAERCILGICRPKLLKDLLKVPDQHLAEVFVLVPVEA